MTRYEIPAAERAAGDFVHGFRVDRVTELGDIRARCYECTHAATGARLVHLHCNDDEKLYAIAFRTPVADSTGTPHILEHSVLAGSRKYPVKDAFKRLGKTSLATYLNAFTYPDKTIYPVCSAVRADYFNLASVYTDLVFHPLLSRTTFMREGHHLELAPGDGPSALSVSGIVYNEMKGAYSDVDSIIGRSIQASVFSDNCYRFDSGGDPDLIPDLTYEVFLDFHRRYYSASNATWFLYGDISLDDNLAFIEERIADAAKVELDSVVREQARWTRPRRVEIEYPIGADEAGTAKGNVNVAWMLESNARPETVLLLQVLSEALIGSAAGPLRRALVESGLGQDMSSLTGYETHYLQTLFTVGLRGSETSRASAIEELCLGTLARLASEGIDPAIVEAAFHQIELAGREIGRGFPVELLVRAAGPLNYGVDPRSGLEFGALVASARTRYANDHNLLGSLIREWLLDNPHRLLHTAKPSPDLAARRDAAFKKAMAERKAGMGARELEKIALEAEELKADQERDDPPEALALLPKLDIAQVPRRAFIVPTVERISSGTVCLEHEFFSNGVAYLDLTFDVSDLSDEESLWLPFLAKAATGMGAASLDYAAMATRVAASTGGISLQFFAGDRLRGSGIFQRIAFRGKALGRKLPELASIFRDILTEGDLGDLKRLGDLVHEAHNRLFQRVVQSGNQFARTRAAASFGLPFLRREQWEGISQLRFLADLAKKAEADPTALASALATLRAKVFTRDRLLMNATGDPRLLESLRPEADSVAAALPQGKPGVGSGSVGEDSGSRGASIGVTIAARVNYVAKVLAVPRLLSPEAGSLAMLSGVLSQDYLYEKLRVQGGAYGGHSQYSSLDGLLSMTSYRDPRLSETMEVYERAPEFFRSGDFGEEMLDGVRVGLIGDGAIRSPAEAGSASLLYYLYGLKDEDRQAHRDRLFAVTAEDIRREALPVFEAALARASQAALGPRDALEAANARLARPLTIEALE